MITSLSSAYTPLSASAIEVRLFVVYSARLSFRHLVWPLRSQLM